MLVMAKPMKKSTSMKKPVKKAPSNMHKMPDGSMMLNSKMASMKKGAKSGY
jgi:hypothetical protein